MENFDVVIAGGGVVGVAVARALAQRKLGLSIVVLEKEDHLAGHQSGHNSGVVHVGYNQKPGTSKARLVVEGSRRLREFCKRRNVPLVEGGITVVARAEHEIGVLEELYRRGMENGARVELIDSRTLVELEPFVRGEAALFAPEGASFNARCFVQALANEAMDEGVQFALGQRVVWLDERASAVEIQTGGNRFKARAFINAGGLQADRIAHLLDLGRSFQVVPFRGDYSKLIESRSFLIRSHVYAAPDLEFPFLGVHFSRTINGDVMAGPGAILSPARESYDRFNPDLRDFAEMLSFGGFWRLFSSPQMIKLMKSEWRKSLFQAAVAEEGRALIPDLVARDLEAGPCGIRAQLVSSEGQLVDDLVIEETARTLHVLNAVSPALTCSLPFADEIVERLEMKYL